jgi:Inverse autotransporter, beta-domain
MLRLCTLLSLLALPSFAIEEAIIGGAVTGEGGAWGGEVFGLMPLPSLSLGRGSLLQFEPHLDWQNGGQQLSLGLVYRHLDSDVPVLRSRLTGDINWLEEGWFYGANLFLDGARTVHDTHHLGISCGVEFGTRYLMFRANYYASRHEVL